MRSYRYFQLFYFSTILFIAASCGNKRKENTPNNQSKSVAPDAKTEDSIFIDSITPITEPVWMGPLLVINNDDAALLLENGSYEDTLPLLENVNWAKSYLTSEELYSIGRNGVQKQQFVSAIVKNPNGDCNRQVVLSLKHQEPRGFLVSKEFANMGNFDFFDHLDKSASYFTKNKKEQAFYESIFGISKDTTKYDLHKFYITSNEDLVIEKRGQRTIDFNKDLQEENIYFMNDEFRMAYKKNGNWLLTNWNPCLKNTNAPAPEMSCIRENEIIIIWDYEEGMGDYQLYVSRIDISSDIPVFENGTKMQGYIGLGCD